jgi:hypothetical protein
MAKHKTRPHALFSIVGILLLAVSFLLAPADKRSEFWVSTIQNVGLIALTVVIVDVLWNIIGGDPVGESIAELHGLLRQLRESTRLLQDSYKTGLRRVVAASGGWGSTEDWIQRLASAKHRLDMMGYSLHVLTRGNDVEAVLSNLVRNNVAVRVLVMSPDNPQLASLVNQKQIPGLTITSVTEEIKAAINAFKVLQSALQAPNFQVRVLKTGLIVSQIVRVDEKLTSVQYLYSAVASRTPIFEVDGEATELFKCYSEEFEQSWKLSEAV